MPTDSPFPRACEVCGWRYGGGFMVRVVPGDYEEHFLCSGPCVSKWTDQ